MEKRKGCQPCAPECMHHDEMSCEDMMPMMEDMMCMMKDMERMMGRMMDMMREMMGMMHHHC